MGENNNHKSMRTALLAGATGLIGDQLLHLLLNDDSYSTVKVITRKPLGIENPKLKNLVIDFDKLPEHADFLACDDVFCCLGTTIKIAKTKEAFKKVDFEYPVSLAKLAREQGASQYLLISALGADKSSMVFYNKVKGEVEESIQQCSFKAIHIVRPSLLLGDRKEERQGEGAATTFFKLFGFIVPVKYKAIDSLKVAKAMLAYAKLEQSGVHIHESKEMQGF
jgi:uncharacterized protein YbjT (DUF2867 family)